MLENAERNGIALGLVLGVSGTLVFIVYGELLVNLVNCITRNTCEAYSTYNKENYEPDGWIWARRLIKVEDSIAQWIMAFFAFFAVILVWGTLRSTNKTLRATQGMASVTKEIGNQQIRPYAFCRGIEWLTPDTSDTKVKLIFENTGHSPAENVEVDYSIQPIVNKEFVQTIVPKGGMHGVGHIFPSSRIEVIGVHSVWGNYIGDTAPTSVRIDVKLSYWDPIFKKRRKTKSIFVTSGRNEGFIARGVKE
jgi:hypothetical protein